MAEGEVGEDALEDLIAMLADRFPSVVGERERERMQHGACNEKDIRISQARHAEGERRGSRDVHTRHECIPCTHAAPESSGHDIQNITSKSAAVVGRKTENSTWPLIPCSNLRVQPPSPLELGKRFQR